ncbi:MAG: EamA family transporter [Rhodothalassiaceae bacterium]
MSNVLFYLATVLIWGSTWYAITFQLGAVPIEWSVSWRFLLSSAILLLWCAARGKRLRYGARDHLLFAGLGALLFSVNYMFIYWGTGYLTSGLVAVVFSLISLFNQANGALFLGQRIEGRVLIGALAGLGGLILIFWHEVGTLDLSGDVVKGILICLAGTLCASLGNTLAASPRVRALPLLPFNGYAMLYGAALMALYALLRGKPPVIALDPPYLLSLAYLAVFGTVLAFTLYLTLLKNWGLGRGGYVAIAIPVVALIVSTIFEDYRWTLSAVAGLVLVLAGNLLIRKPG